MIDGLTLPFYHYKSDNWTEEKKVLISILPKEDESFLKEDKSIYTDFYQNAKTTTPPDYFQTVLSILTPRFKNFVSNYKLSIQNLNVVSMWWQTAYKSQRHSVHNHGGLGWSSILYVNFDSEIHSATTFYTHYADPWTGLSSSWSPNIEEGDLIIFPSYLNHESSPNTSDKKRTIISFNLL